MADSTNNKNIDTDKQIQWLEDGIAEDYINHYDFNEFKNIKCIGYGAFSNVCQATWESSDTVVALKSFINNDHIMKEIVNEVYNIIHILFILLK